MPIRKESSASPEAYIEEEKEEKHTRKRQKRLRSQGAPRQLALTHTARVREKLRRINMDSLVKNFTSQHQNQLDASIGVPIKHDHSPPNVTSWALGVVREIANRNSAKIYLLPPPAQRRRVSSRSKSNDSLFESPQNDYTNSERAVKTQQARRGAQQLYDQYGEIPGLVKRTATVHKPGLQLTSPLFRGTRIFDDSMAEDLGSRRSFMWVAQDLFATFHGTWHFCSGIEQRFNDLIETQHLSRWASPEVIGMLWSQRLDWNGAQASGDLHRKRSTLAEVVPYSDAVELVNGLASASAMKWFSPVPCDALKDMNESDTFAVLDAVNVVGKTVPAVRELIQQVYYDRRIMGKLLRRLRRVIDALQEMDSILGDINFRERNFRHGFHNREGLSQAPVHHPDFYETQNLLHRRNSSSRPMRATRRQGKGRRSDSRSMCST